jgi:hypothetical protein
MTRLAKVAALVVVIVMVGVLLFVGWRASGRRYSIVRIADGAAYVLDQRTGETWLLRGDERIRVRDQ